MASPPRRSCLVVLGVALALFLAPLPATAQKTDPAIRATWQQVPEALPLNLDVDLVLHLEAAVEVPSALVELQPSPGIAFVDGPTSWSGALGKGAAVDLPVRLHVTADGEWTIGARVTSVTPEETRVNGAVLYVLAQAGLARLSVDPPVLMRMDEPSMKADLGIAPPTLGPARPDLPELAAAATIVAGAINWSDPEGRLHAVRHAYVEVASGTGALLARTSTDAAGMYAAAVTAESVQVTVFTQDTTGTRAVVNPLGQPTLRYILRSAVTPVTPLLTPLNVTSAATVRGAPGAPSTDSISARAFALYDAMLTYWFQATALLGRNMQVARANFPESVAAGATCGTSCYSRAVEQMFILREDALDWDILGHEFFHFINHKGATRTITSSPGGPHSGGSAIGENGRTRDEGMRLAWSEGLATVMPLLLQARPPSSFAFPNLANINDNLYQDTEDAASSVNPEAPARSEGYASEMSVLGLLWDLWDTAQDAQGTAVDTMAGVDAPLLWSALNVLLPANPCDRVDRFWNGIRNLFGMLSPTSLQIGGLFALNRMATVTTAPAAGASVGGTVAPTFAWTPQGDPSAAHANNQFYLVFSRDDFQAHVIVIPVPGLGATSYKPTDPEWQAVQAGGNPDQVYKWFVAASRQDAPQVPEGWYWYSDVRTLVPRSLEATITWSPLGADVDLHLSNPSGTDIAYYNKTTAWGFLDRDCITTCTQEIISLSSLPLRGTYRLWVHYYSDHDRGPATVHAVVRSGPQILADTTFVLSATGASQTLASVTITADAAEASVEFAPAKAAGVTLDPALLPPKAPGRR